MQSQLQPFVLLSALCIALLTGIACYYMSKGKTETIYVDDRTKVDSLQRLYDSLEVELTYKLTLIDSLEAQKREAELNTKAWKRLYQIEKATHRTFDDAELDSLISAIR